MTLTRLKFGRLPIHRRSHQPAHEGPPYREPTLGLRLRTRLHTRSLDRALAAGRVPGADADRALRAGQLVDPITRRRLARSLRRVVADSGRPRAGVLGSAIPAAPGPVFGWREALLGIAERLERPVPVNSCGVARVMLLLTDGTGPLYSHRPGHSLAEALWWIADGLQLCQHEWDSPKVMKLDPEHVAWTCRRCGAITTTGDPAVRPA